MQKGVSLGLFTSGPTLPREQHHADFRRSAVCLAVASLVWRAGVVCARLPETDWIG